MPGLQDLADMLMQRMPTWAGGYQQGAAQSRLGRTPMQVIPDEQWGQFLSKLGIGPQYGITAQLNGGPDTSYVPQREFTGPAFGDLQAPSGLPPGSIPRHEAIHAFLGPVENRLSGQNISSIVGQDAIQRLYRKGYNWTDAMREIPARLTTEPQSLGMNVDTGKDAMRKYIELLRKTDSSRAAALSKYLGLSGSEKGDGMAELQRPNDTF